MSALFEKAKHFLKLIRPSICIISVLSFLIATFIVFPNQMEKGLMAAIPVFLTTAFGNVINDFYDVDIDKINRPNRPLPSGKIKMREAKIFAIVLALTSLLASLFLSFLFFLLNLFNIFVAFIYAKKVKRTVFGNLLDSYLSASCFLAPLFLFETMKGLKILLLLSLTSCLGNYSREILKDIEDVEGDLKLGANTLPIKMGEKSAFFVSFLMYLAALIFGYSLYFLSIFNKLYLIFILASSTLIINFLSCFKKKEFRSCSSTLQKRIKIAMFLMLLGYFLGSLG